MIIGRFDRDKLEPHGKPVKRFYKNATLTFHDGGIGVTGTPLGRANQVEDYYPPGQWKHVRHHDIPVSILRMHLAAVKERMGALSALFEEQFHLSPELIEDMRNAKHDLLNNLGTISLCIDAGYRTGPQGFVEGEADDS